jgi:hypothetical protein
LGAVVAVLSLDLLAGVVAADKTVGATDHAVLPFVGLANVVAADGAVSRTVYASLAFVEGAHPIVASGAVSRAVCPRFSCCCDACSIAARLAVERALGAALAFGELTGAVSTDRTVCWADCCIFAVTVANAVAAHRAVRGAAIGE